MEKIIIYSPDVEIYFKKLINVLFKKEYFGFREDAKLYVARIIDFIENNIAGYPAKNTPAELQKYGNKYIFYKANKRTTWYIFFDVDEERYFVKFITNNHTELAASFNL